MLAQSRTRTPKTIITAARIGAAARFQASIAASIPAGVHSSPTPTPRRSSRACSGPVKDHGPSYRSIGPGEDPGSDLNISATPVRASLGASVLIERGEQLAEGLFDA